VKLVEVGSLTRSDTHGPRLVELNKMAART